MSTPRLLVLSNGHGEDLIALRLIEALRHQVPGLQVQVLPLVGLGQAYACAEAAGELRRVGPRLPLPSGGFSNQSLRGLLNDLAAGLPLLSWRQWRIVRRWGRQGLPILAVGDLLPLLLAWAGGGPYGFLGTPKSDHTWASPPPAGWGRSPLADGYHRAKGSEWDPWEWALMGHHRCHLVAVRDRLTARGLRRHGVRAVAPGNPMMDGFAPAPGALPGWLQGRRRLLLLPGSRLPEALGNLRGLLDALPAASATQPISLLLATGSRPSDAELAAPLGAAGFIPGAPPEGSAASALWRRGPLELLVGPGRFAAWAPLAELGLATAGTATEQLVGLGVPALSLPGPGPQFKAGFARRQSRLLGGAVQPCHGSRELQRRLIALLDDDNERARLGRIGRRRMGPSGGSARLAALIRERLLPG
ncbi:MULTISPECIES: lipid-A-disaccharide synthase-related protein [unclassified Cyanobium]|uniref:lipid-A-disaccharide synthase-related protein n=1 Tax=unclassified Cyanobium TaxID=2627006 RepID=UPI0020CFD258|nr:MULTISPECIES: lipid-A-disaccharide synthase-related protein [unclassified Cyanobium]MCP9835027.1 lipid-A-disaccharide synthase-related protein [Cyanobium sp. La Preciosa 7G6]MCP9937790.1 lipid-A-disaccharide synthase-related protein [Cyanobium sp. Aljojuca 7A6]